MEEEFIVLNINGGNAPYLRSLDLAFAMNRKRVNEGLFPFGIIVPLIYGNKQKEIIKDEFKDIDPEELSHVYFDEIYGGLLEKILFDGSDYSAYLRNLVAHQETIQSLIRDHFSVSITVKNIVGGLVCVKSDQLVLELSRNPVVNIGLPRRIYTSIVFFSEIITKTYLDNPLKLDLELLHSLRKVAERIEENYDLYILFEPSTFIGEEQEFKITVGGKEVHLSPPLVQPLRLNGYSHNKPFIYASVSGIPHLTPLLQNASIPQWDILNSKETSPRILLHKNARYHIARAGFGSIIKSVETLTPLIVPNYESSDDLEIYHNIKQLKKLNLAVILEGHLTNDVLKSAHLCLTDVVYLKKHLLGKYGTLDGASYIAEKFNLV